MMTAEPTTDRLAVPGGKLYYEVRGSGPLLLVIGQPMTSGPFAPLADLLATDHTVVTYDPHGLGQSTVDDRSLTVTAEAEADDLAAIIDALGVGPADVFGNSGGAVAGLALATQHPDKVRTLIAHEPPLPELLPDAPHILAAVEDIEDAFHAGGAGAAFGKFVSLVMHDGPVTEAGVPQATWPRGDHQEGQDADAAQGPPAQSEKQQADDELFFLHMLKPILGYEPDVEALRSGRPRVVIAIGEMSRGEVAGRSTTALAEQLGTPAITFPGHHGGFMDDPAGFASTIRDVLVGE
ncbi:MAG TPA: alpha/beta hydrolase [Propionibacteriaceae bacterium]|nr:alpha/beta hydrolase [Propionibacteriaceae bacterium]